MKTSHSLLLACVATLLAGHAHADAVEGETLTAVVRFGDLNLHSDAGVAKLHFRIRAAARRVCAAAEPRDLRGDWQARACVSQAVARAVAQVNIPELTRLASR